MTFYGIPQHECTMTPSSAVQSPGNYISLYTESTMTRAKLHHFRP